MFSRRYKTLGERPIHARALFLLGVILVKIAAAMDPLPAPAWSTVPVDTLLKSRSVNNTIVIMVGTGGFLDLIQNMVCRLSEMQIENYVVNALDRSVWEFCLERNVPAIRVTQMGSKKVYPSVGVHHSTDFKNIVREKQVSIRRALDLGLNVMMTDVDMFWVKNPLEKVASYTDFDFVIQSGALLNEPRYKWINAGFLYSRPTPAAKSALNEVMNITYGAEIREGIAVNKVFCGDGEFGSNDGKTCLHPEHGTKVYILDQIEFQTTDVFLYDADGVTLNNSDPYILHFKNAFNFEYERKRMVMADMGMWLVDASMNCVGSFNPQTIHEVLFRAVRKSRHGFLSRCYDAMPGSKKMLKSLRDTDIVIVIHRSELIFWVWVLLFCSCLYFFCYRGRNWQFRRKRGKKGELLGPFLPFNAPRSKPA